jgi:hypothetical protein
VVAYCAMNLSPKSYIVSQSEFRHYREILVSIICRKTIKYPTLSGGSIDRKYPENSREKLKNKNKLENPENSEKPEK